MSDETGMKNPIFQKLCPPKNEDSSINEDSPMNLGSTINSGNVINVQFRLQNREYYNFVSHKEEFLSSLFYKFRDRINDFNTDFHFINNNFILDPKKKLGEVNPKNSTPFSISVFKIKEVNGSGYCSFFTDLSKQIYEEHYFSDKAPSYRVICKGINIYGICKSKKCKAYNKEVIAPLKKRKEFDLIKERDNLECPECEGIISPKTVGFHLCEYKIKETKYENGEVIPFEFNAKADNKDSVQYYNPDKNGQTTIAELIIEITKYL